ncbi:MAG: hypothetical protein IT179_00625 [Acidobacteria bacterium]|nr:hypothetical protein [Acidobacteriota bacterium]
MARMRGLAATLLALAVAPFVPSPNAPGAQSRPLPDRDAFFAEVQKRLASNDIIQSRYSYRQTSTELKLNPFGRMGTGPVLVHEVYPHPDEELTYRRLIERESRPLSATEIAEQDREYLRKLEAWNRRTAREGESARRLRLQRAQEGRERDEARAREALEVFDFAMIGRDTWEGEPAIILSFTPRPGARPRTREGRIARAFAGRAWVHEHEYEVMNVEATAVDDVSFGFGIIAKLHAGSTAKFVRRRIDGRWMPVESRFDGTGRALLVRRVVINFRREYSDYRPFEPDELPARLGAGR